MECPTVRIKSDNEQGYVVINESDFDVTRHVLFDAPTKPEVQSEAPRKAKK